MTKREAKRWVCATAAALLATDIEMGEVIEETDRDEEKKKAAMQELIRELVRRGKEL